MVSQIKRCPEIAFSDHQKAEIEDTETIMENRWILSKFDMACLCDCTYVLITIPKWRIWYVTHYIKITNLKTPKLFIIFVVYAQTAISRNLFFTSPKRRKWTKRNTEQTSTEMTIPFKFGLGISVRLLKHKWQMKNIKFYTLHLDNNLPNIENIYYIHYIGKGIDVVISRFQLTKTLKMNIRKHSS